MLEAEEEGEMLEEEKRRVRSRRLRAVTAVAAEWQRWRALRGACSGAAEGGNAVRVHAFIVVGGDDGGQWRQFDPGG